MPELSDVELAQRLSFLLTELERFASGEFDEVPPHLVTILGDPFAMTVLADLRDSLLEPVAKKETP